MEQIYQLLSIYPFPDFLSPLPDTPFITEEIIGCTNETVKGVATPPINPRSYFFCFKFISFQ